jgi:hypothetical protein
MHIDQEGPLDHWLRSKVLDFTSAFVANGVLDGDDEKASLVLGDFNLV